MKHLEYFVIGWVSPITYLAKCNGNMLDLCKIFLPMMCIFIDEFLSKRSGDFRFGIYRLIGEYGFECHKRGHAEDEQGADVRERAL